MAIILVASEKGGTAKSTIATNLAVMRAIAGRDVLLVDADLQQSASNWAGTRVESSVPIEPTLTCVTKIGPQAGYDIVNMVSKFDDVVIDAGGRDSPQMRSCLVICDVHVLSVIPSQFDTWTLDTMDQIVANANAQRTMVKMPKLKSIVVCAKTSPNPSLTEHLDVADYVKDFGDTMEMTDLVLFERVIYRKAVKEGKGIVELAGRNDKKAVDEISALYEKVFGERFEQPLRSAA